MSVLNPRKLLERIRDGRCVKSTDILTSDEKLIVSRKEMPCLYANQVNSEEKMYLRRLIRAMEPSLTESDVFPSGIFGERLEQFYLRVLDLYLEKETVEAVLHQFLFRFWNSVDSNEAFGFPQDVQLFYKCKSIGDDAIGGLLGRLRRNGCECDLVAYSIPDRVLWFIDAKRDPPDDRAIGQIRRYYQLATAALEEFDPKKNIRLVRPALVCPRVDVSAFHALGTPFRDLCEIWTFRVHANKLHVQDERLKLLSQIRHKRHLQT